MSIFIDLHSFMNHDPALRVTNVDSLARNSPEIN